jgi:N-acetylmuramoyl-L-alanine amidase
MSSHDAPLTVVASLLHGSRVHAAALRCACTLGLVGVAALLVVGCGDRASGGGAAVSTQTVAATRPATTPRRVELVVRSRAQRLAKLRPPIVSKPIALTAKRRRETVTYALRHYGLRTDRLRRPHVIVEHYTETPSFASTYRIFAPDTPDVELHELPGLCAQFVVDRDGTIYQLTPIEFMCRHTVGLNYTAIGIEHVAYSDEQVLTNTAQIRASLQLTRWLRCRERIATKNIIGHNESLSSPYHHENVARVRNQTHADWPQSDMQIYRRKLAALGPCPS